MADAKLDALGLKLPPPAKPFGVYRPVAHTAGNLLYISGHGPMLEDGKTFMTGTRGFRAAEVEVFQVSQ